MIKRIIDKAFLLIFLVFALILVLFCTNNMQEVEIDLYPTPLIVAAPVWILVLISFFAGALLTLIILLPGRLILLHRLARASRRIKVMLDEQKAAPSDKSSIIVDPLIDSGKSFIQSPHLSRPGRTLNTGYNIIGSASDWGMAEIRTDKTKFSEQIS